MLTKKQINNYIKDTTYDELLSIICNIMNYGKFTGNSLSTIGVFNYNDVDDLKSVYQSICNQNLTLKSNYIVWIIYILNILVKNYDEFELDKVSRIVFCNGNMTYIQIVNLSNTNLEENFIDCIIDYHQLTNTVNLINLYKMQNKKDKNIEYHNQWLLWAGLCAATFYYFRYKH